MIKKAIRTGLLILLGILSADLGFCSESIRFEFHNYEAEGYYDFFRIDINTHGEKGTFCYFSKLDTGPEAALTNALQSGKIWSEIIDINKVTHVCTKFDIYKPFGWFIVSQFDYAGAKYQYVFIGKMKDYFMEGEIFEFRDCNPSGSNSCKVTNLIKVRATGKSIAKRKNS